MGGDEANALKVVIGWLDAMRRGDLGDVAGWFDPRVTWSGVGGASTCDDRAEVLEMLGNSLEPCAEDGSPVEEDGMAGAWAIELIAGTDEMAVLGAKVPGLGEVGGISVRGQLFSVFRVRDGRIVEVADYALRHDALRAAGARSPSWA